MDIRVEKIHRLNGDGNTKAFVDISIGGTFVVKGLRVVQGSDNLFVSMPREKGKNGKWYDMFYPLTRDARKGIEDIVFAEYSCTTN